MRQSRGIDFAALEAAADARAARGPRQSRGIDFAGLEAAAAARAPRGPRQSRRAARVLGRLAAWTLLVPSTVTVGLELERAAHVETWQAISTIGWWEQLAPGSLERAAAFVKASIHPAAWDALANVLTLSPGVLGLGLALPLFLVASLARGDWGTTPLWVRLARMLGLVLAGLGFAASGADLYQSGASHSVAEFLTLLHAASAQSLLGVDQPMLATALRWPAWLALLIPGSLLLFGSRVRS